VAVFAAGSEGTFRSGGRSRLPALPAAADLPGRTSVGAGTAVLWVRQRVDTQAGPGSTLRVSRGAGARTGAGHADLRGRACDVAAPAVLRIARQVHARSGALAARAGAAPSVAGHSCRASVIAAPAVGDIRGRVDALPSAFAGARRAVADAAGALEGAPRPARAAVTGIVVGVHADPPAIRQSSAAAARATQIAATAAGVAAAAARCASRPRSGAAAAGVRRGRLAPAREEQESREHPRTSHVVSLRERAQMVSGFGGATTRKSVIQLPVNSP